MPQEEQSWLADPDAVESWQYICQNNCLMASFKLKYLNGLKAVKVKV
jgi:hypothetical protein